MCKKVNSEVYYDEVYKYRKEIERLKDEKEIEWLEQELKNFFSLSVDERWKKYTQNLK